MSVLLATAVASTVSSHADAELRRIETVHRLEAALGETHRQLQDSASAADVATLETADEIHRGLVALLQAVPPEVIPRARVVEVGGAIDQWFAQSRGMTARLIGGDRSD